MRADLVEMRAAKEHTEQELHNVLLQLHSTQLQIQSQKGVEVDSSTIQKKVVGLLEKKVVNFVKSI